MKALTVPEIIRLWETAYRLHPVDRALAMLQEVLPDRSRDELAALTLGQRDSLLMELRRVTFGNVLAATSDCPKCLSTIEFELDCTALQGGPADPRPERLLEGGYSLTIRPLNSFDLAAAASAASVEESRAVLLDRCVSEASFEERPISARSLPEVVGRRVSELALASDSQAETLLSLDCPECQHNWQSALDIVQILWLEISARAQRLLMEVHRLASAYGWRERDILELSPERRAAYLQMVGA